MRQIRESEAELESGEEGVSLEELKAELGSRDASCVGFPSSTRRR